MVKNILFRIAFFLQFLQVETYWYPPQPITRTLKSLKKFSFFSEKTKCNRGCPFNWEPQCGSDGKTYSNKCTFEVAQCHDQSIRLVQEGPCPGKHVMSKTYAEKMLFL